MYSIIVFLCTMIEVGAGIYGYLENSPLIFGAVVVYGSPIYMFINLLGRNSAFLEKNPIYIVFAIFHLVKYFAFFRAQGVEDSNAPFKIAIFLEAIYLATSAYYSI